jgi:hypothetical protein
MDGQLLALKETHNIILHLLPLLQQSEIANFSTTTEPTKKQRTSKTKPTPRQTPANTVLFIALPVSSLLLS